MISGQSIPRPLDHMVLPVADLGTARARLQAIGFTVAPEARHPFGTSNACVYLADGTFLEPLAVADRETCEAEARAGNVFVARDQAFRFRNGNEGFSALVLGTENASADDRRFREAGISAGTPLEFSRIFTGASGDRAEAAFHLAFAADLRAPDTLFFTCERVRLPEVDRTALERHANGTLGISEVVLCEENPADFQYLLQQVVGQRSVESLSFGITLPAANGRVSALTPEGARIFLGEAPETGERGLRLIGIVFRVRDLVALERLLRTNGMAFHRQANRVVVGRAPGQGALFAFEECA